MLRLKVEANFYLHFSKSNTYILEIKTTQKEKTKMQFHMEPLGAAVGQCRESTDARRPQPPTPEFLTATKANRREPSRTTRAPGCSHPARHRRIPSPETRALPLRGRMHGLQPGRRGASQH